MSEFNVFKSIKEQEDYCKNNHLPHFAPYDGVCWNCGKNIYESDERGFGITTKKASSDLITGCPHCFKSYCD